MKTENKTQRGDGRVPLQRLVRLFPRKQWFIVWGGYGYTCTPQPMLKWTWMGEPLDWFFDGAGPYERHEIDAKMEDYGLPNTKMSNSPTNNDEPKS